jgi:hypothetical protein
VVNENMAEKTQPQPIQSQSQIVVPEDLRQQVQEYSIRSNGYDVARRDYSVEANKLLTALLQKINVQEATIKGLQAELAKYKPAEDPKAEPKAEPVKKN